MTYTMITTAPHTANNEVVELSPELIEAVCRHQIQTRLGEVAGAYRAALLDGTGGYLTGRITRHGGKLTADDLELFAAVTVIERAAQTNPQASTEELEKLIPLSDTVRLREAHLYMGTVAQAVLEQCRQLPPVSTDHTTTGLGSTPAWMMEINAATGQDVDTGFTLDLMNIFDAAQLFSAAIPETLVEQVEKERVARSR